MSPPPAGDGKPTTSPLSGTATCPADLSVYCYVCGSTMRPEHAHYRCPACGWRDSCCDGPF